MNFQDWTEVKWDKRSDVSKSKMTNQKINSAMRNGTLISIVKKGNINKEGSNGLNNITNLKKIEKEEETFKHAKVSLSMGKRIAQVRNEKKMSQKDFANAMCVPLKIIQDYELSKAIPNHIIINKNYFIVEAKIS